MNGEAASETVIAETAGVAADVLPPAPAAR